MTLAELWEWMISPTKLEDRDEIPTKKGSKYSTKIDPGIHLKFPGLETNPLAPTYTPPIHRAQPETLRRNGTMPRPSLKYWDAMLFDVDNPDEKRKF